MNKKRTKRLDSDTGQSDQLLAHTAASTGDVTLLVKVIQRDPVLLEQRDRDGFTPLAHAVQAQNLHVVKRLVKMGADINSQDTAGRTYLSVAAYQGWNDGVLYLLRKGANQNLCDKSGRTPLHASTYDSDIRTLSSLLQQLTLKEVNETDNEKMTVLHWAAFHDRPEHVRQLLHRGVDPLTQDMDGKTPLHWAAQNGCRSCCSLLVPSQQDTQLIHCQDNTGKTAAHLAAAAGHAGILQDLAEFDLSVFEMEDQDDRTAIHWASAMGHAGCIQTLLQIGVSPDPLDVDGGTPLEYARQANYAECVHLLEERLGLSRSDAKRTLEDSQKFSNNKKNTNPIGFLKALFRSKNRKGSLDTDTVRTAGVRNSNDAMLPDQERLVHGAGRTKVRKKTTQKSKSKSHVESDEVENSNRNLTGTVPRIEMAMTGTINESSNTGPASVREQYYHADSERNKEHQKQHKKKRHRCQSLEDKPSTPKSWMTMESEADEECSNKGGNNYRPSNRVHHLSPLEDVRVVSPLVDVDRSPIKPGKAALRKRPGELEPLSISPTHEGKSDLQVSDLQVSPRLPQLDNTHESASNSSTPQPMYLRINVNSKKTLPGINIMSKTSVETDKETHHRNRKKKKKHKKNADINLIVSNNQDNPSDDNRCSPSVSNRVSPHVTTPETARSLHSNINVTQSVLANSPNSSSPFSHLITGSRPSRGLSASGRSTSPTMLVRHPSDDNISLYKLSHSNKRSERSNRWSTSSIVQDVSEIEDIFQIPAGNGKLTSDRRY